MNLARHAFALGAAATLLAACGGGGGGGNAPAPADPHALATSVDTPSYSAGSGDASTFTAADSLRDILGSGLLAQNAALDQAALAHWDYVTADPAGIIKSHDETPGQPGFTGVDPDARAQAAGYQGSVTEFMYATNTPATWGACMNNWANSVYHAALLFSGAREIGIAARTTPDYPPYGTYTLCVLELGLQSSQAEQLPVDGTVRVYPYAGQADVPFVFQNHTETPVPLPAYSELGPPILLNFKTRGNASGPPPTLVISTLQVAPDGGAPVAASILARAVLSGGPVVTADANLDPFTVALVPTARLQPDTSYRVSFQGSVGGQAVSKSWTFHTAAGS